jgi:hypothetical protein
MMAPDNRAAVSSQLTAAMDAGEEDFAEAGAD